MAQKIANATFSQEVAFVTDEGGIAYRHMNAMMVGLRALATTGHKRSERRDDRMARADALHEVEAAAFKSNQDKASEPDETG